MKPDNLHHSGQLVPGADRSGYIAVLDGWRAFAIALVLSFHCLLNADLSQSPHAARMSRWLEHVGPFGVLIFFAISGYLITGRIVAEYEKTGRFSLREFYYKRAYRILPLSYGYLLFLGLLWAAHGILLTKSDLAAPFFLTNYFPGHSWYTSNYWSLAVEEHFYILWPPVIALVGWRRSMWIGFALIVGVGIWRPFYLAHAASIPRALLRTDTRLDFLMMGSVVAIAAARWIVFKSWVQRLGSSMGCVALGVLLIASTMFPWSFMRSIEAVALTGLVCCSSLGNSRVVKVILANPAVVWVGQISYSIYIIQQFFFAHSSRGLLNQPWVEVLKIPVILALSWLSYTYLERPLIRRARSNIQAKLSSTNQMA